MPFLIVLPQPIFRNFIHFRERVAKGEVQNLFFESFVESFNVPILCGLKW